MSKIFDDRPQTAVRMGLHTFWTLTQQNMELKKSTKGWEIDLLPINESTKSGDCILLRFGDLFAGKEKQDVFIIDGGFAETAKSIKSHLKNYYNCFYNRKYNVTAVILTHTDQDHISGLVKLIEDDEVNISNLIVNIPWVTMTPAWFKDGRITRNSLRKELQDVFDKLYTLIETAKRRNVKIWNAVDHLGTLTCSDAKIHILGPSKIFYNSCIANSEKTRDQDPAVPQLETTSVPSTSNEEKYIEGQIDWPEVDSTSAMNESSIVFLFEYEGIKILFTGDSGRDGLAEAMEFAYESNIDVSDTSIIKMPHHGSRHNISPDFLDIFTKKNKCCYISCAKNDEGHHPSKRLVNLLNEKGFRVYTTSGSTLHRSANAPDRGWTTVKPHPSFSTMEKLDE